MGEEFFKKQHQVTNPAKHVAVLRVNACLETGEHDPVTIVQRHLTPLKAIRQYCVVDCASGHPGEVRKCAVTDCRFFIYRMGHNPARRGIGPGAENFKGISNAKRSTQRKFLITRRAER